MLITNFTTCSNFFLVTPTHIGKKNTFQFLLKCDFKRPFSDWNVVNGRHISVTIQSTLIADLIVFQLPISYSPFKKFYELSYIELSKKFKMFQGLTVALAQC